MDLDHAASANGARSGDHIYTWTGSVTHLGSESDNKGEGTKVSENRMSWYASAGSVKAGNLPDAVQSNLPVWGVYERVQNLGMFIWSDAPESTMTPPTVVPCPPIHFVAL